MSLTNTQIKQRLKELKEVKKEKNFKNKKSIIVYWKRKKSAYLKRITNNLKLYQMILKKMNKLWQTP